MWLGEADVPARFDLDAVKFLVKRWLEGDDDKIWFTPRKKSFGAVGFVFQVDDVTAQETIAHGLLGLDTAGFFQQQFLSGRGTVVDVYGLENYRGQNWYVKFYLLQEADDHCVSAISFHPLDENMKCENGKILEVTYFGERSWKSN